MFSTILVPLDGSEFSDQILGHIRALIRSGKVEHIYLIQVVAPDCPYEELVAVRDRLLNVGKSLSPREVIVDVIAIRGDPAEEILSAARRLEPSLVAMATHGRGGFSRLIHGSVTEEVLRRCQVPLLLANSKSLASTTRATAKGLQRVLVPLVRSEVPGHVFPLIETLGKNGEARVTLLEVLPLRSAEALRTALSRPTLGGGIEPDRIKLQRAGATTELKVTFGARAEEIIEAARNADLVALTSPKQERPRWWSHSVAESVVRHCSVPMLVYPAEAAA